MTPRQWYLKHLDAADYDTTRTIDALVVDIENAPEGEYAVILRAGVRARLADAAKSIEVRVRNGGSQTIPMFQSIHVEGRRVRAGILRFLLSQTEATAMAYAGRGAKAVADAEFWAHNLELHRRHPDLDLGGVYEAEGVSVSVATGTDG